MVQGKIINYLVLEAPKRHDGYSQGQADPGGLPRPQAGVNCPAPGVSLSNSFFVLCPTARPQAPEVGTEHLSSWEGLLVCLLASWREKNLFAKDGSVPHHLGVVIHWDLCNFKIA